MSASVRDSCCSCRDLGSDRIDVTRGDKPVRADLSLPMPLRPPFPSFRRLLDCNRCFRACLPSTIPASGGYGWHETRLAARPLVSCQGQGPLCGLSNPYFKSLGLPSFFGERGRNFSNRRVRTRSHGGVAGVSGQPLPLCRSFRHVDWKTGTASGCDMRRSSRSRGRCPGDTSCEKIRG